MPTIKKLIATTTSILFTLNRSLMMIYHLNSLLNTFATLLTAPIEATSTPDTADLPTDLISHAFRRLTNNLSCFAVAKLQ
ncbi:MAG: hypothetical protein ACI3Z9_03260, partial [Candidatus Onthomorpha sp.]